MPPVVLILESSPELRRMLEEGLRQEGYAVKSAPEVEEALAVMRRSRIDVVLADLPTLDAIHRAFPGVSSVLISPDAFDPEDSFSNPPEGRRHLLLRTPFTLGELLKVVGRAADGGKTGGRSP